MQRWCKPGWLEPVRTWCEAGARIDAVCAHMHEAPHIFHCISQHWRAALLTTCPQTNHQGCGCMFHTVSWFFHWLLDWLSLAALSSKLQLSSPNPSMAVLLPCFHSARHANPSLKGQLHSFTAATRLHTTGYTSQKLTIRCCGMYMRGSKELEQADCKHAGSEGAKQKEKQQKQQRYTYWGGQV